MPRKLGISRSISSKYEDNAGVCCVALMSSLAVDTWLRFLVWLTLGLAVYFFYGRRHARSAARLRWSDWTGGRGSGGSVEAGRRRERLPFQPQCQHTQVPLSTFTAKQASRFLCRDAEH